jgi:hypothetical protein
VFASTVARIAWGGQPQAHLVHIQLSDAFVAGSQLLVEQNARGVRVRLMGLPSEDRQRYRDAIERRLGIARVAVDEIDVE